MLSLTTMCSQSNTILRVIAFVGLAWMCGGELGIASVRQAAEQDVKPDADLKDVKSELKSVGAEPYEVMLRGPVHEAFASPYRSTARQNQTVKKLPPRSIVAQLPLHRPVGNDVQWIDGYWAWEQSQDEFVWVSGIWRDVPPSHQWVPGYWQAWGAGVCWVSGYWSQKKQTDITYLPTPPPSRETGVTISSPGAKYFYCPGNWEYVNQEYRWRSGRWQTWSPDWIWQPAQYTWTPQGSVYHSGYWDYPIHKRGVLFSPIRFRQTAEAGRQINEFPRYTVPTDARLLIHLYVNFDQEHYSYGDWMDQEGLNSRYMPWCESQSHFESYDPMLSFYSEAPIPASEQQAQETRFVDWISNQRGHYLEHPADRSHHSLDDQLTSLRMASEDRKEWVHRATLAELFDARVKANAPSAAVAEGEDKQWILVSDLERKKVDKIREQRRRVGVPGIDGWLDEDRSMLLAWAAEIESESPDSDLSDETSEYRASEKVYSQYLAIEQKRIDAVRRQLQLNLERAERDVEWDQRERATHTKLMAVLGAEVSPSDRPGNQLQRTREPVQAELDRREAIRRIEEFQRRERQLRQYRLGKAGRDRLMDPNFRPSPEQRERAELGMTVPQTRRRVQTAREERAVANHLNLSAEEARVLNQRNSRERNQREFARRQAERKRQTDRQSSQAPLGPIGRGSSSGAMQTRSRGTPIRTQSRPSSQRKSLRNAQPLNRIKR